MNEFYMLVTSDTSKAIYEDNTQTKFTNILPHNLQLSDDWHVALQSLTFNPILSNIPESLRTTGKDHFMLSPIPANEEFNRKTIISFSLRYKRYYTSDKIMEGILNRLPPTFAKLNLLQVSVSPLDKLVITISKMVFYIQQDMYDWLKLTTDSKNRHIYIGTTKYLEYDGRNRDVILSSTTSIYEQETTPNFIKIKLAELKPNLSGGGFNKELALIPFPKESTTSSLTWYEVKNKEYFKLASSCLSNISVELSTNTNNSLDLLPGSETILKLKFKNMQGQSSFITRLQSNDSLNIYPNNNAAFFRIQLPHSINFNDNNWQVALSSIHYPNCLKVCDFLNQNAYWIEIRVDNENEDDEQRIVRISFEDVEVHNVINIRNVIQEKINTSLGNNIIEFGTTPTEELAVSVFKNLTLRFSHKFNSIFEVFIHKEYKPYYDIPLQAGYQGVLPGQINLNKCLPQNLLLCTDFTTPIIVGDKYSNVLKLIPMPSKCETNEKLLSYEAQHLDFMDIPTNQLQTIQFDFRTLEGIPIKFKDENAVTYINLLFRKK